MTGIDFNGVEIKQTKRVYNNLLKKLHPNRITLMVKVSDPFAGITIS